MIKLNSKGMKEDFGVGIAFNIISGLVQFFYNRLLLTEYRQDDSAGRQNLFHYPANKYYSPINFEPDGLLKQMIEIAKELFLLFPSQPADLFYPFGLCDRARF